MNGRQQTGHCIGANREGGLNISWHTLEMAGLRVRGRPNRVSASHLRALFNRSSEHISHLETMSFVAQTQI